MSYGYHTIAIEKKAFNYNFTYYQFKNKMIHKTRENVLYCQQSKADRHEQVCSLGVFFVLKFFTGAITGLLVSISKSLYSN